MPNWNELTNQIKVEGSTYDIIRRQYLEELSQLTGRNVILYYSGWLQKNDLFGRYPFNFAVNDNDKNGFMAVSHRLDKSKGVDLILHTPGGEVAATESLVDYLRSLYGTNIRAIVPQLAMSAGTMIACACKEIVMGKHSSLGPIDPQIGGGIPAHGIIEEMQRVIKELQPDENGQVDQAKVFFWQQIISKYQPTLIGECEKNIAWSNEITKQWLKSGMFEGEPDGDTKADQIISELADHALQKSHSRHISMDRARRLGLKIRALEDDQALQEAVLSVHHICIQTLTDTPAIKLLENQLGVAFIQSAGAMLVLGQS